MNDDNRCNINTTTVLRINYTVKSCELATHFCLIFGLKIVGAALIYKPNKLSRGVQQIETALWHSR